MEKVIVKIAFIGLIVTTLISCGHKNNIDKPLGGTEITDSENIKEKEIDDMPEIPQITNIIKIPDRLTKEIKTYTVTLITEGKKVTLDDTEFSIDGKNWRKTGEFKEVTSGKYTFYARNKRNKSLLSKKEHYFEPYMDVPLPTIAQLNDYIKKIADYDDKAIDAMRKCLGNDCRVKGVGNIENVQQLILDISTKSRIYSVTNMEVKNGIITSISVNKN